MTDSGNGRTVVVNLQNFESHAATLQSVFCCLGLLTAWVEQSAIAQGTINFFTRVRANVNAPVTFMGENTLADGRFLGQLFAAAPGETLGPVGTPTPFRSDAGKGYITAGGTVDVPGVQPGSSAQVKLVAWAGSLGSTYADAMLNNVGGYDESPVITISLGGGILPPAALVGLPAFGFFYAPEPSAMAILALGMAFLWPSRKCFKNRGWEGRN
jgi:hypothetical protein